MEVINIPVEFVSQREEFGIATTPLIIEHILKLLPDVKMDIEERRLRNPNQILALHFVGDFVMSYSALNGNHFMIFIHKSNDMKKVDLFFKQNKMGELTGKIRIHLENALNNLNIENPDRNRRIIFDYEKN